MKTIRLIIRDWGANKGNSKGKIITFLFRLASGIRRNTTLSFFFFPLLLFYRVFVEWVLGIELHWNTVIGEGLKIYHGQGSVINGGTTIGRDCTIRHGTTIGHKKLKDGSYSQAPALGNNIDIGANVCIIGNIRIGDNVIIGAGSIVTRDIPPDCIVMGNPAKVI